MAGRRLTFWLGVAGVSLLANFGAELVADRLSSSGRGLGLARFVAFTHKGAN